MRKPIFGVSDKVGRKPGCLTTEDGQRLRGTSDHHSRLGSVCNRILSENTPKPINQVVEKS